MRLRTHTHTQLYYILAMRLNYKDAKRLSRKQNVQYEQMRTMCMQHTKYFQMHHTGGSSQVANVLGPPCIYHTPSHRYQTFTGKHMRIDIVSRVGLYSLRFTIRRISRIKFMRRSRKWSWIGITRYEVRR